MIEPVMILYSASSLFSVDSNRSAMIICFLVLKFVIGFTILTCLEIRLTVKATSLKMKQQNDKMKAI